MYSALIHIVGISTFKNAVLLLYIKIKKVKLYIFKLVHYKGALRVFSPHNMPGNIKLNVRGTNNHVALTLYFANLPLKTTILLITVEILFDFREMQWVFP